MASWGWVAFLPCWVLGLGWLGWPDPARIDSDRQANGQG